MFEASSTPRIHSEALGVSLLAECSCGQGEVHGVAPRKHQVLIVTASNGTRIVASNQRHDSSERLGFLLAPAELSHWSSRAKRELSRPIKDRIPPSVCGRSSLQPSLRTGNHIAPFVCASLQDPRCAAVSFLRLFFVRLCTKTTRVNGSPLCTLGSTRSGGS
jgi:hypothetical protein